MIRFESNCEVSQELKDKYGFKTVHVKEFTMDSKKEFIKQCDEALDTGQTILPITIDSYGGSVYALLGMFDYLQNVEDAEVVTICDGVAMSCGAALFTCGKRRFLSQNGTVLFHDMSWVSIGKDTDIQSDAKNAERLKKILYHTISTNLGHDKDWLLKNLMDRGNADWFLNSKECKQLNVATKIGLPKLVTRFEMIKELRV